MMLPTLVRGPSLLSLLTQILVSSQNTLTDTSRNDVLPAIWTSLSPIKLTHTKSTITVPYLLIMSYVLNSIQCSSSRLKPLCEYMLHSTNMSWAPATRQAMGWVMPRAQEWKDMVPALLGLIISEQSTHNKICPKKRHADPWEDFLGGKRQLGWDLKDDNRWYPPTWLQISSLPFTSCVTPASYLTSLCLPFLIWKVSQNTAPMPLGFVMSHWVNTCIVQVLTHSKCSIKVSY